MAGKGGYMGGRSRKGVPNKSTAEIKDLIDKAGKMSDVVSGLYKMAPTNPRAAEILLAYRFGKPKEFHEISSNEFKVIFEHIAIK